MIQRFTAPSPVSRCRYSSTVCFYLDLSRKLLLIQLFFLKTKNMVYVEFFGVFLPGLGG